MRPMKLNPNSKQKLKPSQFFEYFINRYGTDYAITRANNQELTNRIKYFILDLVYGNVMQDKYLGYVTGDESNRLVLLALNETEFQLRKAVIYCEALRASKFTGQPSSLLQEFDPLMKDEELRQFAFIVIKGGLTDYLRTKEVQYLQSITYKLSNPLVKRVKQILF